MTQPASAVVGMVGGGQLARMTAHAAGPLDVRLRVLARQQGESATRAAAEVLLGDPDDAASVRALASGCDAVTFDHELVGPQGLEALLATGVPVRPSPEALRYAQDKAFQRQRFTEAGLDVPAFRAVDRLTDARAAALELGLPVVMKTTRGGYDGRGVWPAGDERELTRTLEGLKGHAGALVVEEAVPLASELAVLVARRPGGERVTYPLVETVQQDGICTELAVPARVPDCVAAAAVALGERAVEITGAIGLVAVELFWTGERVLVNEVATRPHNSGHWTIEGAVTSQFANHLRAVLDWPLGVTCARAPAVATVNVLGAAENADPRNNVAAALGLADVAVHLYGKEPWVGRKLGHVTALGDDADETRTRAREAAARLRGGGR
ncbi:MAG: 5-(carboxyamino)imidazole ribonucleotide synthase [Egibacteraceae bacterium]